MMTTDAEKIAKKTEDKGIEAAKADLSAEKGNPGVEDNTSSNKSTSNVVDTGAEAADAQKKAEDEEREKLKIENEKKAVEAEKAHEIEGAEKIKEGVTGTFQRKDGTISSTDHPDRTATYVGGTRVMLTKAEKDSYTKLNEDLNKLQNGRGISDIPLADPFWQKKSELDQFITNLRR